MTRCGLLALLMGSAIILGGQVQARASGAPAADQTESSEATDRLVQQAQQSWFEAEWKEWKARFVSPDGRVVDNGNNDASHSEGQGYGLLLAAFAKDRQGFEQIWGWTDTHLFVRPDGLAAWRWDEKAKAVADRNNATDGDLLMAWGLARASAAFGVPAYRERARTIALAVGRTMIIDTPAGPTLLPGGFGFRAGDQPDGPIVNPSYFVFPAFDALIAVAPEIEWARIKAAGLKIITESRFGPQRLPADWVSLAGKTPQPARNFPPTFGYDAIRIPLYLAWSGLSEAQASRFSTLGSGQHGGSPFVIDLKSGASLRPIDGAGVRMIVALSRCLAKDEPLPQALIAQRDTFYYPATLRLLTMALIEERYPECL
ncbi:glycosyl hydrolase family 8 [Lichenifustis flavocetrariae]|uniref:cellulase n=1 Tax=Lichenifustis flavocetrariae TaxID=2949735 RepID=A0AA41YWE8_9HYPH|nr:glycosyl hydrolase family 8 [Lichenifustis flavocetrariae]MCW6508392.1 glycosyl hydrolase family 8 [Lichenifustis flavocetrariae]